MKQLTHHTFDSIQCRREWDTLSQLLKTSAKLKERDDILPLFGKSRNLSLLISRYFPDIKNADVFACEYEIYGDFKADLIIGDSVSNYYLLVEFEDGEPESIFKRKGAKATPDWSNRFETAFSQLLDWIWKLEDMRQTQDFMNAFGTQQARFQGLIVIGKNMQLSSQEKSRLEWRNTHVVVASKHVNAISFDELSNDLDFWLKTYYRV